VTASFDTAVAEWVAQHRFGPIDGFFVALGTVEKLGAIWIACSLVLGIASRRGFTWTAALVVLTAVTTFVADSVSFGIKDFTHRPRPFVAHPQIHPLYVVHSSSFPAGHAATAFAGATLLTYVAPRLWPLFVGLATAVSFSRVYVGVHYPTDVLAGAAIGVGIGALGIAALMLLERWNPHSSVTPRRAAPA
jgi:membrane-associated phospholipid phosphatase